MKCLVLKSLKVRKKREQSLSEIQPGQILEFKDRRKAKTLIMQGYLKPVDPRPFIEAGIAKPTSQETFEKTFSKLAEHLRQRDYTPENFTKLQELSFQMDAAWNTLNYPEFKKVIDEMMRVPGTLRSEGKSPIAALIYSKVLNEEVWVASCPEATSLVPEGEVVYLADEILTLKGAPQEDIKAVHRVKKELGGQLIAVGGGHYQCVRR